jgi:hypothetical protein
MIDNVVINARALSIITVMADVPRDRSMAAHMIIRLDLDKYDFYFIFVMESEDKYKTSGGNSLAVKRLQQLYQCR